MEEIIERTKNVIEETKDFLVKGVINAAADCLMRLIYDYKLPAQIQIINRKIVQESSDLAKRFLECFRNEANKDIITKLAKDENFVKSNPMLNQLFS
jgi:hypothetical protein